MLLYCYLLYIVVSQSEALIFEGRKVYLQCLMQTPPWEVGYWIWEWISRSQMP